MAELSNGLGISAGLLLIFLLILEVILVVAVVSMSMQVRRLSAKYNSFMKGQDGISLEKDITRKMQKIEKYAQSIDTIDGSIENLFETQKNSIHKYGIVKYDAFDDVGGKLSFVLALLDEFDTGFVLNAVHSKENCFLYIKEIVKGESYIMLSNEEVEALRLAKRYGTEDVLEA